MSVNGSRLQISAFLKVVYFHRCFIQTSLAILEIFCTYRGPYLSALGYENSSIVTSQILLSIVTIVYKEVFSYLFVYFMFQS